VDKSIRVLLVERFSPEEIKYLESDLNENIAIIEPIAFSPEVLAQTVKDNIDVLFGRPKNKEILENGKDLKLIQVPWSGVDRLDFEMLRRYSIPVCSSHSNAGVTAEYAVSMMLATAKQLPLHDRYLRMGKWCRPRRDRESIFLPAEPVNGKTIGIIGYGTIGKKIADLLAGFSVKIQAVSTQEHTQVPEPLSLIVSSERMLHVVEVADFLFITVPLTDNTRNMIDKAVFGKMKSTSFLINTSRGDVIVEEDLYNALKNNEIAGAAVDNWYNYPKPGEPDVLPSRKFPFHELDNLVLSPHRAGNARGYYPNHDDAIENINRLAAGKPFINVLDLAKEY